MTLQDLGQGRAPVRHPAARAALIQDGSVDDALGALFASSPERPVHTSAAAELAFLAGLAGVVAAPFTLVAALCVGVSALGLVSSIVGLARASRPDVAGSMLASLGLVLSLATMAVVALRYAG